MKISPLNNYRCTSYKGQTTYHSNKIIEEDIATFEDSKSYFENPASPKQDLMGFNLIRENKETLYLKSRFNHIIGKIQSNPDKKNPKINIIGGSHQPVIELVDEESGLRIYLNRGSNLIGEDLKISYKKLDNKIFLNRDKTLSFGNNLFMVTGYKSQDTKDITESYFSDKKYLQAQRSPYSNTLKNDYTIVGLAAGYGTRIKPISDLFDTNKPATKYPCTNKSFLEVSCLDTASRAGKIDSYAYLEDGENNISGTLNPIIKGLNNGTIPLDKPLVLLTSDTFNNIDLARALSDFENDGNIGIGIVAKNVRKDNLFDVPLIKATPDGTVVKFHEKINRQNCFDIVNSLNQFYTSTNIMVIHPKILELMKDFKGSGEKPEFLEFLDSMFTKLNKNFDYPNKTPLKVKLLFARDTRGKEPYFADMGSMEKFIETIRKIKDSDNLNGLSTDFNTKVKQSVDENGIIFMQDDAKEKFEHFKQKYNIQSISGNVIVSSFTPKTQQNPKTIKRSEHELTKLAKQNPREFVKEIMKNPDSLEATCNEVIKDFGLENFIPWYLSSDGYYGAYESYVDELYQNADSLDELLKFMPNWSPWKLEEKFWSLNNPQYKDSPKDYIDSQYTAFIDGRREVPFVIGELPNDFSKNSFNELVHQIKTRDIESAKIRIYGTDYDIKRLKGGELNDKFAYIINCDGRKYILKTNRTTTEDNDNLGLYERKTVKKNKIISADSIFANACMSRYLQLNGCKNTANLHYYDYENNAVLYEFVDDIKGDLFQSGEIDAEYNNLNLDSPATKSLKEKGVFLNDMTAQNFLTEKDGTQKVIDFGHANFIVPFKPGVKHYNIEFGNVNGPDFRVIYASLFNSMRNN